MTAAPTYSERSLRSVKTGREWVAPGHDAPRHRHLESYALIVVQGALEQVSYAGRVIARSGDMLVQPTLDCHMNAMVSNGADILRLPWPREAGFGGLHALQDLDALVRLAEHDPREAARLAHMGTSATKPHRDCRDWPDLLADDLAMGRVDSLADWAASHGLARETVARGFAKAYGVAPARFRTELRARTAWLELTSRPDTLANIAVDTGFADQAHMTRAVGTLTGRSPGHWRRHMA